MTAWHGGKGSGSRPRQVSNEDYANRWDAIFQRDKSKEEEPVKEEAEKDEDNENSD